MSISSSKKFDRDFKKCPQEIKDRFIERLEIFKTDKYNPILKNHSLSGKLNGLRSINVSGSYRAIFEEKPGNIIFISIGTHSQLYK